MISTQFDDGEQRLLVDHCRGTQVGRHGKRPRAISYWSFFHQDGSEEPARVGPFYRTKAALLADMERYGREFGF